MPEPQGWTRVDEPAGWTPVTEPEGWTPVEAPPERGRLKSVAVGATRGLGDLVSAESFIKGAQAVPDIARNIQSGALSPTNTAKEAGRGALDAVQAMGDKFIAPVHGQTRVRAGSGLTAPPDRKAEPLLKALDPASDTTDPWEKNAHRVTSVIAMLLAPELSRMKGGSAVRGLETAGETQARLQAGTSRGTPSGATSSRIAYRMPDTVEAPSAQGLETAAETHARLQQPPPEHTPGPTTSRIAYRSPDPAPKPIKVKTAKPAATPEPAATPALPESWQKLVDAPAATPEPPLHVRGAQPPLEDLGLSGEQPMWNRGAPEHNAMADARGTVGAERAGDALGMEPDAVRDVSGAPKRRPLIADNADLDLGYARRLADPKGAVNPKLLRTVGLATGGAAAGGALANDEQGPTGALLGALAGAAVANPLAAVKALQTLRVTGMLSGAALGKSMTGNVGAFLTAGAEGHSLAPIKELLRVPTNLKNAVTAFRGGANPSAISGLGKINIPGRLMGAFDEASTAGLQRAGLSLDEAQRLLLTKPNPLGQGSLNKAVQSPLGRMVIPFQRTPFNQFIEGLNSINELAPGSGASLTRKGLTVGAAAGGAVAGDMTDNPVALAILAALAGPRALPFALGAGLTAGPEVLKRVGSGLPDGSFAELYDPLRPINQPALLRLLESGGR